MKKKFPLLKDIDLIVYDFDGVMTDNTVYTDQNGIEMVKCTKHDSVGVDIIKELKIKQMILSKEKNPTIMARGKKIGLGVIQGSMDKKRTLIKFCNDYNVDINRILYVGNDTNDLEVMKIVGYAACPADSHIKVRELYTSGMRVLSSKGGEGVVREIAELLQNRLYIIT